MSSTSAITAWFPNSFEFACAASRSAYPALALAGKPTQSKPRTNLNSMNVSTMKKLTLPAALLAAALLWNTYHTSAQDRKSVQAYEYATVKWDGPDRLFYNLPDKFELVHLHKVGVDIPRDTQEEEWCLMFAANKMAKDGWEPVNLNSRRILFRRAK